MSKVSGVVETARVPIGGWNHQKNGTALRHRLPVELNVAIHIAGVLETWRFEPEDLLDGARDEGQIGGNLPPLIRVVTQQLAGPAYEPHGRLVSGAGHDVDIREDLGPGQGPSSAGFVYELGVE